MNSKNKKIVLVLVLAIIIALIGAVAIFSYLRPQRVTMYVFKDDYKAGTYVTDDILTPILVDRSITYGGRNAELDEAFITNNTKEKLINETTNFLKIDVSKGMPLTQSMLTINNWSKIQMEMDEKKVAVTIPINSISGVSKELTFGSRVNIYMSSSNNSGNGTELLFENMKVLAVNKNDYGELISATIEVNVAESLSLINAAENYSIYFALVNGQKYQAVKGNSTVTQAPEVTNPPELPAPSETEDTPTPELTDTPEPTETATPEPTKAPTSTPVPATPTPAGTTEN